MLLIDSDHYDRYGIETMFFPGGEPHIKLPKKFNANRDVHGFAMKATWTRQNGSEVMLQKDPVTDRGGKKSHRGRLAVVRGFNGQLEVLDNLNCYQQSMIQQNLLKPVWRDGEFLGGLDWSDIRSNALS